MNQNDNRPVEVLQEWRDGDGNVDLDAARSGMVDVRHRDAILSALLDEVQRSRAERDLAQAVVEAIDLPAPATYGDEEPYLRLLERRVLMAVSAVHVAEENPDNVPSMAHVLRKQVSQSSITYKLAASRAQGGESR